MQMKNVTSQTVWYSGPKLIPYFSNIHLAFYMDTDSLEINNKEMNRK